MTDKRRGLFFISSLLSSVNKQLYRRRVKLVNVTQKMPSYKVDHHESSTSFFNQAFQSLFAFILLKEVLFLQVKWYVVHTVIF